MAEEYDDDDDEIKSLDVEDDDDEETLDESQSLLLSAIAKRNRQRTVLFSPDQYEKFKAPPPDENGGEVVVKKRGRGRRPASELDQQQGTTSTSTNQNKWKNYISKMNALARTIGRELHCLNVFKQDSYESKYLQISEDKILRIKKEIYELFEKIAAENSNDRVWASLLSENEDKQVIESVNVEEIYCSRCSQDIEDGDTSNDILLCDHKGCGRAYHQKCLDPPAVVGKNYDPTDDWFCWQCNCLDECLDHINEVTETSILEWKSLFPELNCSDYDALLENMAKDDDSENDEDYKPKSISKRKKSVEGEENVNGVEIEDSEADDNDDEDEDSEDGSGSDSDSDSDSDSENDGEATSGSDVEVDQEEMDGLLSDVEKEEAGASVAILAEASRDPTSGPTSNVKRRKATGGRQKSRLQSLFVPTGSQDIGLKVATVVRGVVAFGTVVSFLPGTKVVDENGNGIFVHRLIEGVIAAKVPFETSQPVAADESAVKTEATADTNSSAEGSSQLPEEDSIKAGAWFVRFEDGVESELNYEEVISAVKIYAEYEQKKRIMAEIEEKKAKLLEEEVAATNIVEYKRSKQEIDYATLLQEMYGNEDSDDEDDEDFVVLRQTRRRESGVKQGDIVVSEKKPPPPIQFDADGNPIKRKRGRPPKNRVSDGVVVGSATKPVQPSTVTSSVAKPSNVVSVERASAELPESGPSKKQKLNESLPNTVAATSISEESSAAKATSNETAGDENSKTSLLIQALLPLADAVLPPPAPTPAPIPAPVTVPEAPRAPKPAPTTGATTAATAARAAT
eukprot:gene28411-37506_t